MGDDFCPTFFSQLTLKVFILSQSQLGLFKIEVLRFFLFPSFFPEEVATGTVLPLWSLNTDISFWHPGTPYAAVGCSDQWYCHPTLYIAARPRVGMFPLCRKAAGYTLRRSLRLHAKEAIHQDDKWGEVATLPEARLQVLAIFLLLRQQY